MWDALNQCSSVPESLFHLPGLRGTRATICFLKLLKWFYHAAKLENGGDGREGAACLRWPDASREEAGRSERGKGNTGRWGERVFGAEETVPELALRQAKFHGTSSTGQETPEWLETREGTWDEGVCRAHEALGFYAKGTWEIATVEGLYAGE